MSALLAIPAPADAGIGSLKYIVRTRNVHPGETKSQRAPCPSGTSVVGGGVNVEGGHTLTTVNTTAPYDGSDADKTPDDGWIGAISNGAATPAERLMTVFAICATSGKYRYTSQSLQVPTPSPATNALYCEDNMVVTGGGVSWSLRDANARVSSSAPVDNGDVGDIRSNGWGASGDLKGTKDATMRVTAICTKPGANIFEYVESTVTLPATGAATATSAQCDFGFQVTGGGVTHNDDAETAVHSTEPLEADADGVRDDGWTGKLINVSGASVMTTVAICWSPL